MNYKTLTYFVSAFLLLCCFTACTYDNLSSSTQTYTYNHASTTLKWTAYKYTTRVGVSGTFDEIIVKDCINSNKPMEVVENMNFTINTQTIDSESTFRDNNILDYFFHYMNIGEIISGKVNHYTGDDNAGLLYMNLTLNGIEREIPFDYRMEGTIMHIKGNFSLSDFDAVTALDSMQHCCKELHTGADGVHLLWPDIQLEISTDLNGGILVR